MNIEVFNSLLTLGTPIVIKHDSTIRGGTNTSQLIRLYDYYRVYGCPTIEEIDNQNARVKLNIR